MLYDGELVFDEESDQRELQELDEIMSRTMESDQEVTDDDLNKLLEGF